MKCCDCPYFWEDYEEENGEMVKVSTPFCHYKYNDGYAPCEVEQEE